MSLAGLLFLYVLIYAIAITICGLICKSINEKKGYYGGFAWGFLGVLGIIVVAVRSDNIRSYYTYNQIDYINKLSGIAQNTNPASQVQIGANNSWRCSCGRLNSNVSAGCVCGRRKEQVPMITTGYTTDYERGINRITDRSSNNVEKDTKTEIDNINLILKYKELLDAGIISDEEFEEKKKELLNKKTGQNGSDSGVKSIPESEVLLLESKTWICNKCGAENQKDRGNCFYCGAVNLDRKGSVSAENNRTPINLEKKLLPNYSKEEENIDINDKLSEPEPNLDFEQEAVIGEKVCQSCGFIVSADDRFCGNCGATL